MGLFGRGNINSEFLERIGNLLILPYRNEIVWFERSGGRKLTYRGYHGGPQQTRIVCPICHSQPAQSKIKKLQTKGNIGRQNW